MTDEALPTLLAQTRRPPATLRALAEVLLYAQHAWSAHRAAPHDWCERCRLTTERFYRVYCEHANAVNAWLQGEVIRVDEGATCARG